MNESPSTHLDDDGSIFARNVRVSLLGVSPNHEASFSPFSLDTLADDWQEWCASTFTQILGPSIRDTIELGQSMQIREIAKIDQSLAKNLGEELSEVLIEAAIPFTEGKANMRGHREWSKYMAEIEASNAPGHLPILFALHSVLFRMPLVSALQAYCWLEWKTGHRTIDRPLSAGHAETPPPLFLIVEDSIANVLRPNTDDGFPQLKAI